MYDIEKIICATIYDNNGEKIKELENLSIDDILDIGFEQKFPTWIIAYCPDTSTFFVTNKRYFYWEYDKEFATEEEGIEYFEKHVKKFMDIENRLKDRIMLRRFVDPMNSPVFLENTGKSYHKNKE